MGELSELKQGHVDLLKDGIRFRKYFCLIGAMLIGGAGVVLAEHLQSNMPQPAYEHAFVEGDEKEPKVGDIYYLRNEMEKAGKTDYFKVRVRNKVVATFGEETKVFLVIIEELDEFGEPIPGTQNTCLLTALFDFEQ